jgi:hypothetical protein
MADDLTICSTVPEGAKGTDDDPFNPLARAANKLVTDGDPIRKISACYFDAQDSTGPFPLRWFGVFVHSFGERLILFPGLAEPYTFLLRSKGNGQPQTKPFKTDHITLESDMKTWHVTGLRSKTHAGAFPTADVGSGRYLWCGISVSGFNQLREVKQRTVLKAPVPETDGKRRADVFTRAREGLIFNTLQLNARARRRFTPGFLHFTVVVGLCGFPDYKESFHRTPDAAPYVTPPLPVLTDMAMRSHRVSIPPFDIEIITSWLPGRLNVPILFTS